RAGSPARVEILALGESKPSQGLFVDIRQHPELARLNERKYRLVAPYDYFRPGKNQLSELLDASGMTLAPREEFVGFARALGQRIASDATLKEWLNKRQR